MLLHTRKVGRTILYVDTAERSTLQGGRPRTRTGTDTVYTVRAAANRSRSTVNLGTFPTLDQAREYVDAYAPNLGLLS